jgi:hypothetical protein
MDREKLVTEAGLHWKINELSRELIEASAKLVEQQTEIERLRAALGGMLRAVCGHDGFAAAIRQTSGMMYPWPALDAAEREARAALAQEKPNE